MDFQKKEIIALLVVMIAISIVGIDLFASQGSTSKFSKSGAKVLPPIGTSSSVRCEKPFRTVKMTPQMDIETGQIQFKPIDQ